MKLGLTSDLNKSFMGVILITVTVSLFYIIASNLLVNETVRPFPLSLFSKVRTHRQALRASVSSVVRPQNPNAFLATTNRDCRAV